MSTPSLPTLPRRYRSQERLMVISALRYKARHMQQKAYEHADELRTLYRDMAERYDALADRIRDGGPLSQQIYYGIRVPLRERRDQREDRNI